METVPFFQSFKDDRMTTWRFLRYSMQFSEHLNSEKWCLRRLNIGSYILLRFFIGYIFALINACVEKKRPSVEFLPSHASSAVHRISVSPKQAGSVNKAAGQQIDQFGGKQRKVSFSDNWWEGGSLFGVLVHNAMHFVVFGQCGEDGNMAGTKILSWWLLIRTRRLITTHHWSMKYLHEYNCKDI